MKMNNHELDDDFFADAPPLDDSLADDWLAGLNPQQRQAVETIDGPLMILAGPGSGKTRVVTHRVANMIRQGIPANQIVALTFTNKAAEELKLRIAKLVPGNYVWAGTFHRFCSRLLRQYAPLVGLAENFSILDMDDAKKVLGNAWEVADIADDFVSRAAVQNEISRAKNAIITHEAYEARPGNAIGKVVQQVYPIYQRLLLESNSVDFDDLLTWTAIILQQHEDLRASLDSRFAYIMVDEYQDTNLAQYAIVRSLSNDFPNLAITGDPDQSIYGWRGANIQNILGFERDYPKVQVVRLEQNYRSTQAILSVADHLIAHNTQRKAKRLITTKESGDPVRSVVFPSPHEEADFIARDIAQAVREGVWQPKDIAVFYRANWLSRNLEHAFNGLGIPFQLVNGFEFYQRAEVKDLIAYLRLISNPKNDIALERVINSPARKIGKVTLDRLRADARNRRISLLEACRRCLTADEIPKRSTGAILKFVEQMDQMFDLKSDSVQELLQGVLKVTGYREVLEINETEQSLERIANIDELLSAAREFDNQHPDDGGLDAYLETAALASDTDKLVDGERSVKMMTMHAAKGLEFPCVYIVGLEEGILPHERSRDQLSQLEEERRLFFVGITRAEKQLTISRCEGRMKRGQFWVSPASSFLMELPSDELDVYDRRRAQRLLSGHSSAQMTDPDYHNDSSEQDWIEAECGGVSFDVDEFEGRAKPQKASLSDSDERTAASVSDYESHDLEADDFAPNDLASKDLESTPPRPSVPKPKSAAMNDRMRRKSEPSQGSGLKIPGISTAAAMFGLGKSSPEVAGEVTFRVGMMVEHPEYGAGKITAISGSPSKQMGTVMFFTIGEKKFRLRQSPLKPIA